MDKSHFKFYKTRGWNLEDTLYAGNVITGDLFLYDNEDREWRRSLYSLWQIIDDTDFVEIKEFQNGCISISDALFEGCNMSSLVYRYPSQFGDMQININSRIPEMDEGFFQSGL